LSAPMNTSGGIALLPTGIPGFDLLSMGGLPKDRTTLVTGTTGSAKTVFVTQFLIEGIRKAGEPCVFVTLEESPADIRDNMLSFGWGDCGLGSRSDVGIRRRYALHQAGRGADWGLRSGRAVGSDSGSCRQGRGRARHHRAQSRNQATGAGFLLMGRSWIETKMENLCA
jgi:RecA/RadA recombinase